VNGMEYISTLAFARIQRSREKCFLHASVSNLSLTRECDVMLGVSDGR
jgi:hypothetical protein